MNQEKKNLISYLSGYLEAISSIDEYEGSNVYCAFVARNENKGCESIIKDIFPEENVLFREIKFLSDWQVSLESSLKENLLLKKPLNLAISNEKLAGRRKYLSFKVMDIIDFIIEGMKGFSVYRASIDLPPYKSNCCFYLFLFEEEVLILQFC